MGADAAPLLEPAALALERSLHALQGMALTLQQSEPARALRASVWAYPLVNLAHLLGVALLLGAITVLDLRMLGLWRAVPLDALARPLVPTAAAGLALALATGPLLFIVQAADYLRNPWFALKFAAIAVGLLNVVLVRRTQAWKSRASPPSARPLRARRVLVAGAVVSLVCWLAAATSGRMIAYW